jgi:hypothetical protein
MMYLRSAKGLRRGRIGTVIAWVTVVVAASGANIVHAAELRIPTTVVAAGGSADASITYRSAGAAVAGMQCDLTYDEHILITAVTTGSAGLQAGKMVQTSLLSNGALRILLIGFNQSVIPDGSVMDLKILVSQSADPGTHTLRCDNAVAVTPDADGLEIAVRGGRIVATPSKH